MADGPNSQGEIVLALNAILAAIQSQSALIQQVLTELQNQTLLQQGLRDGLTSK